MLRPHLQSANISYSMQKRWLFKIDYVCKIPWGGGAGSFLAGSLNGDKGNIYDENTSYDLWCNWPQVCPCRYRSFNINLNYYCIENILKLSITSKRNHFKWAPSSEFVSSSIPSWQILSARAQPFRGAKDLAFCLKVPPDSLLVWASSGGSGETARMRLTWTFAARIGDKYQIRLTRSISFIPAVRLLCQSLKHRSK